MDDGMNDRQYLEYLELIKNIGKKGGIMNKDKLLEWLNYWKEATVAGNKEESPEPPPFGQGQGKQTYQQIVALITKFDKECVKSFDAGYKAGVIEKPEVTEEWIEEKARELLKWWRAGGFVSLKGCMNFIRSLVEEDRGNKQTKVDG